MIKKTFFFLISNFAILNYGSYAQMQRAQENAYKARKAHYAAHHQLQQTTSAETQASYPSDSDDDSQSYQPLYDQNMSDDSYQDQPPYETQSSIVDQYSQDIPSTPRSYTNQTTQANAMGTVIAQITSPDRTSQTNPINLQFSQPFSINDLEDGLILTINIYPPTSGSAQQYLIVGFLKTFTGVTVAQSTQLTSFQTLPTRITLFYNGQPMGHKRVFYINKSLTLLQNLQLFNSQAPVTKNFMIQVIGNSVIAI